MKHKKSTILYLRIIATILLLLIPYAIHLANTIDPLLIKLGNRNDLLLYGTALFQLIFGICAWLWSFWVNQTKQKNDE